VVGCHGHLAHQVAGDEHCPALCGQVPEQVADPGNALGVQTIDRLVENQRLGIAQESGSQAEALTHAE